MKPDEAFELLDAVGVIESEKDGLFVAMVYPSYRYDKAEGCKLLINHENITESTFNSLIDEAMSRGKRIEKLFRARGFVTRNRLYKVLNNSMLKSLVGLDSVLS